MADCRLYDFANDYCVESDQTELRVHLHSILSLVSLYFRLHGYSAAIMIATDLLPENAVRTKNPNNLMQLFLLLPLQFPYLAQDADN